MRKLAWSLVGVGLVVAGAAYAVTVPQMEHEVRADAVAVAMIGLGAVVVGLIVVQFRS